MKKIIVVLISIFLLTNIFGQEIEKIIETELIKYSPSFAGGPSSPYGLYIDEIYNKFITTINGSYYVMLDLSNNNELEALPSEVRWASVLFKIKNDIWGVDGSFIALVKNGRRDKSVKAESGVSFILKKGTEYIVYYVDKNGIPGAVDSTGRIYTNKEAIDYLKEYDSEKYKQSLQKAEELGLKEKYEQSKVLVWGNTYYSTVRLLEEFWKPDDYLYPYYSNAIQYDSQGNGYMELFLGIESEIDIVSYEGEKVKVIDTSNTSIVLKNFVKPTNYTANMYVGYGGNIYYFYAGKDFTEIFRIRRTWAEPNIYAMAINGYTDDNYGKYVVETLSNMSKPDLRLLRNTVFALYGVHFNSADLVKYFDKEVWYTDEGKLSTEVVLPDHRKKLVEMILEEESKR